MYRMSPHEGLGTSADDHVTGTRTYNEKYVPCSHECVSEGAKYREGKVGKRQGLPLLVTLGD